MKTRKRFVVVGGAIAIIMVLAGLGIAEAFGNCGGPFSGFRGQGKDMAGFVLKRMDSRVEKLNLTPEQKTKYEGLKAEFRERLLAAKEERKAVREMVRTELAKESPDVQVLSAIMKKRVDAVSGMVEEGIDRFAEFYSILDEGQKQKVLTGIRKKMAAMDKCREEKE